MALTFSGGQSMPVYGTPAYNAAASAPSGAGSFNASTGVLSSGGNTVYNPSVNSSIASANKTSPVKTVSPVTSASAAQDDYTSKYAAFQELNKQIAQQSEAKARADLQKQADLAQKDLQASAHNLESRKVSVSESAQKAEQMMAEAKLTAAKGLTQGNTPTSTTTPPSGTSTGTTAPPAGSTPTTTPNTGTANPPGSSDNSSTTQNTNNMVNNINGIEDQRTTALNSFLQTANNMIVGMQQSESALVSATTQQFQNLMESQKQTNAAYTGQVQEAQMRSGGEYTPEISGGMVANAVSYGNQKLSELNSKMATTISDLNLNFSKEEYSMMNSNFDKLDSHFKDREAIFKEVHDAVAADAKTAHDDAQKVKDNISSVAKDAAKNGADAATMAKINGAKTETDAIANAGDYLQTATGTLGDYLQYKRDATSKGLTPMDYNGYKDQQDAKALKIKTAEAYATQAAKNTADANNTASDKVQQKLEQQYRQVLTKENSARSGSIGIENAKVNQANHLNSLVTQYYDPKTGNYNVPQSQYSELVLGLASLVANNGNTSEGERASIQAKTLAGDVNGLAQYLSGSPKNGNTQEIIKNLVDSIDRQAETAIRNRESALDTLRSQVPTDLEPSRVAALNKSTIMTKYEGQDRISKSNVNNYVKANPKEAASISALYKVPGATDQDVEDYLKAQGKI